MTCISKRGTHIVFAGLAALLEEKKRQAWWVVRTYKKLLQVQFDAPKREMRPYVRKLLTQVKVEIVKGSYRGEVKLRY